MVKELFNVSNYRVKSLIKVVYNLEFEVSYEKEGDFDNYFIGIS